MSAAISGINSFAAGAKEHLSTDVSFVKNQAAQRNKELKTAREDIKSGDIAGAKVAFADAKQDTQQIQADRVSLTSIRNEISSRQSDVATYTAAVQSDNAGAAQAALTQVKTDNLALRADFTAFRAANTPAGSTPPITVSPADSGSGSGSALNVQG